MKKYILITLVSISTLLFYCSQSPEKKLVGRWTGINPENGDKIEFIFDENGTVEFTAGKTIVNKNTAKGNVFWQVNDDFSPMHLDIYKTTGFPIRIPLIIKFISRRKLLIQFNEDELVRAEKFDPSGKNQIELIKQ